MNPRQIGGATAWAARGACPEVVTRRTRGAMARQERQRGFDSAAERRHRRALDEQWLTIQEVADRLRVSRDTVERWIHAGYLRAVDVTAGNGQVQHRSSWRISAASVAQFLERRANRPLLPGRSRPRRKRPGIIEFIK